MKIEIPKNTNPPDAKVAILLNELMYATASSDERRMGHWIGCHSSYWRAFLGGKYRQVIRLAEKLGYVEVNNCYSPARFAKSYRLSKRFRHSQFKEYVIKGDHKKWSRSRIRLDNDDLVGSKLVRWFSEIEIPQDIAVKGWDKFCVRAVHKKIWYASRCAFGRFHSTFTGLPGAVRRQLRIEGKPVVELDIKNAQPLFLGLIAAGGQNFFKQSKHNNNNQQPYHHTSSTPPIPICCIKCPDWQTYLASCSKGEIYEKLLELCQSMTLFDILPATTRCRLGNDRPLIRDDVKRQFLTAIFSKNETMKRLPVWRVFAANFPTIATFVENAKASEYQKMARDCQRFESQVMIDSIAGELADSFGVITVHDSILCAVENATLVEETIRKKFRSLGVDVAIGRTEPICCGVS